MTLTGRDGDAIAVLLDEMREHIGAGMEHLKRRRLVLAVDAVHHAERCRDEIETMLSSIATSTHWQSYQMLDIELRLLDRRIRLAIGI